jgi:membrane protein insertase Oxa1/YidC/SpoIIIJ
MIFVFTINLPSALGLYWFVSGLVAFWQQARILKQDEEELEEVADAPTPKAKKPSGHKPSKITIEGEIVSSVKTKKKTSSKTSNKRRK